MPSSPEIRASVLGADDLHIEPVSITRGGTVDDSASHHAAGRLEGFREGRHEGLELGLMEGRALAQSATASTLDTLAAVARDLRERDATEVAHIEELAVVLALELAEAILERELEVATNPGADAIRRALGLRADREPVKVHLHPDDAALVGPSTQPDVTIVVDPALPRGGATAELGDGIADLSIAGAIARVREALA